MLLLWVKQGRFILPSTHLGCSSGRLVAVYISLWRLRHKPYNSSWSPDVITWLCRFLTSNDVRESRRLAQRALGPFGVDAAANNLASMQSFCLNSKCSKHTVSGRNACAKETTMKERSLEVGVGWID